MKQLEVQWGVAGCRLLLLVVMWCTVEVVLLLLHCCVQMVWMMVVREQVEVVHLLPSSGVCGLEGHRWVQGCKPLSLQAPCGVVRQVGLCRSCAWLGPGFGHLSVHGVVVTRSGVGMVHVVVGMVGLGGKVVGPGVGVFGWWWWCE